MDRRSLVALYRDAVLGVDLGGRVERAATRVLTRLHPRRVALVAAGKSAGPMADAVMRALRAARIRPVASLVVAPDGCLGSRSIRVRRASHPLLDERSVRAGRAALAIAEDLGGGDLLLVLVSGGASAVLAAPRRGVTLRQKRALHARLLRSGWPIQRVNRERARLSAIKGGGLTRAAAPARVVSLVASDVHGDDPAVVGSGPAAGAPAVGVARPKDLLESALTAARARGYRPRALPDACRPCSTLADRYSAFGPGLGIAVGEPTLHVHARTGPGGRAGTLALLVALRIVGRRGVAFLAAGSDGRDGPTGQAGAIVTSETCNSAERNGNRVMSAALDIGTERVHRAFGTSIPRWKSPLNLQDLHIIHVAR